jgi:hypothetical protein
MSLSSGLDVFPLQQIGPTTVDLAICVIEFFMFRVVDAHDWSVPAPRGLPYQSPAHLCLNGQQRLTQMIG